MQLVSICLMIDSASLYLGYKIFFLYKCGLDDCFLDGCSLRWLLVYNQYAEFKQVKIEGDFANFEQFKIDSYYANFEQARINGYCDSYFVNFVMVTLSTLNEPRLNVTLLTLDIFCSFKQTTATRL